MKNSTLLRTTAILSGSRCFDKIETSRLIEITTLRGGFDGHKI